MNEVVDRLNAALEGRYRVERELGAGGMATVYLADDLRHRRKVALKVLRPELAAVVGAERFLTEIRTTANLQHPHILPLFDSGEADSFLFYVMPYVEGETLRDRLDREHQLPVADAVRIARDVAEALDYAHGRGVIHRDIKPANILMQAGRPVIADFGIALAVGAAGGGRLTETGLSVGTPHYMSPEQATGDGAVGPASDVYALACVLYEMLVGEPPHTGGNAQAILGKIITGRVAAPTEHRASVPPHVDAAIRRALERIPADRFADAAGFAEALGDPGFRHGADSVAAVAGPRSLWNPLSLGAVALATVLGALAAWSWTRPAPSTPLRMLEVTLEEGNIGAGTLAPDGSFMIYSAGPGDSGSRIRWMSSLESEPLVVRCCARPQVSPDGGSFIDFDGRVGEHFVSSITAGTRTGLGRVRFAAWGRDGSIYLLRGDTLYRQSGPEAEPVRLATVALEGSLVDGQVLPGGRGIVVMQEEGGESTIFGIDTSDGSATRLLPGTSPRYLDSGHLVYARGDGAVMAVAFDADAMEVEGTPVPTGHTVSLRTAMGVAAAAMSLSDDGTLLYQAPGSVGSRIVRFDRNGSETVLATETDRTFGPTALSPDGSRIATTVVAPLEPRRLVVRALPDGPMTDIAPGFDLGNFVYPSWDPGGRWVYFSNGDGIWRAPADGGRAPEEVFRPERPVAQVLVAGDGTLVLRTFPSPGFDRDILVLAPGDSVPREFFPSAEDQSSPALSPDGRWLAYHADGPSDSQIFVRPFPSGDAQYTVSSGGGRNAEWASDGRELFFLNEGALMSVEVSGEETLEFSPPRLISRRAPSATNQFGVFPDGRSFLSVESVGEGSRYVMVLGFKDELKRLVPR